MTRLRRTLATLLFAAAVLPMSAVALPTDTTETNDEGAAAKTTVYHLLNGDEVKKQERAIQLISHYAHTGQFDSDFYKPLVASLRYVVVHSETESLRIMAVSALHSIGSNEALGALEAHVDDLDSERVTRITKMAVRQYETDRKHTTRTVQKG